MNNCNCKLLNYDPICLHSSHFTNHNYKISLRTKPQPLQNGIFTDESLVYRAHSNKEKRKSNSDSGD